MLRINKYVDIMNVPEEQPFVASNSTPQHVAILISYSGETEGVLKIANILKRNRTPLISLTSIGENSLRKLSDCALSISTREKLYSKIATYSTNNSIHLILDILYSCLFKMDYDRNLEYKTNVSKNVDERVSSSTLLKEE